MSKYTRQRSVEYVLGRVETLAIGLIWLEYKVYVGRKVGWAFERFVLSEQGG